MAFNIELPKITATNPSEQVKQLHSYLFQMTEQLNWALSTLESSSGGNASPASPAIKMDQGADVSSEKDAESTFNSIKALIIKSADIVNAYYEKIDNLLKLSGNYVAEASFPEGSATFVQQTNSTLSANSEKITTFYNNQQTILSDIETIKSQILDVDAYIETGVLYTDKDGVPIYGLEVGQRTKKDGVEVFNKYARFTANKLSFYDSNGYEAAYISDKKLYIDNVEINISFKMGGFVDTVQPDKGVVTKWVQ